MLDFIIQRSVKRSAHPKKFQGHSGDAFIATNKADKNSFEAIYSKLQGCQLYLNKFHFISEH